jgi:hypothetical protein
LCGFSEEEIAGVSFQQETVHKRLVSETEAPEIKAAQDTRSVSKPEDSSFKRSISCSTKDTTPFGRNADKKGTLRRRSGSCILSIFRVIRRKLTGCSLMLFHGSRLGARTDDLGNLLLLQEQDETPGMEKRS